KADEQRSRAELLAYAEKLAVAQSEWRQNNGARALELLEECQWNLRGWEHRHLWALFHSNQRILRGHTDWVTVCAWSPEGKRVLSGSHDRALRVWDAQTGQIVLTVKDSAGRVNCCAWSPDSKRLLSGNEDRTLSVWDAEKGQELLFLQNHT